MLRSLLVELRPSSQVVGRCVAAAFVLLLAWMPSAAARGDAGSDGTVSAVGEPGDDAGPSHDAEAAAWREARKEVRMAEEAYHRAAESRDRRAFHAQLDPDIVFLGEELHRGRIDVLVFWAPLFEGKYGFRYRAETLGVEVAQSLDLAWTYGEVETSFVHPASPETPTVSASHYLNVWRKDASGAWRVSAASTLVVHPEVGSAREARSGLMSAWPELSQYFDAEVSLTWHPESTVRAASGELAFSLGSYEASFVKPEAAYSGGGSFLAVWRLDAQHHWQLAAEGFTPPQIHGGS